MRRTPIRRYTPAGRQRAGRTSWLRHAQIAQESARARALARTYRANRQAVYDRAGGRCEACGAPVWPDVFQANHRLPRAAGRDDRVCNLMVVHPTCHEQITNGYAVAVERGWTVPRGQRPEDVPLVVPWLGRVYLTSDCGYRGAA